MKQKKKILVTGAAGFIGYYVAQALLLRGDEVVGLDNINDYYDVQLKYGRLQELGVSSVDALAWNQVVQSDTYADFSFVRMNLEDRDALPKLFVAEKFDAVINLAAQAGVRYSLENPNAYIDSNIVGFLNILECCRHNSVDHLLYASSSSVYGENGKVPFAESDQVDNPVSLYAATKKSNELMAHSYSHLYHIPTTALRFFTVYGPWGRPDMAPMLFASAITKGEAIKVFNQGHMSRDFTFITDIVNGILVALERPNIHTDLYKVYNLGNGAPVSLMEFIKTLEETLKMEAKKNMLPMQPGDVPRTWADTSSLNGLGYHSKTAIQEGVKEFVDWYTVYYNKN